MIPAHVNRLANEKSPYLLQHADNPVDWHPWGDEAFEKAEMEDKPIFLSIGYSTCHWCHVMAHESFEDPEVAALMNEAFISIKVDREERPDIDNIYMTVCQMLTGQGGWPLTIIMAPDKKPFYAATYIPKRTSYGRIGMLDLAPKVKELWQTNRRQLLDDAEKITVHLRAAAPEGPGEVLGRSVIDEAYNRLVMDFDGQHGGFGSAPKFPTPHVLMFLLRYWHHTGQNRALAMAESTLQAMAGGGIKDHLGFGFHRYSVDQSWLIPHFEKMLYDQALLTMAYTEAFQATGKEQYRTVAEEILSYVLRDMTDHEGGFHSAEDADSEGEEGKFYIWTETEIREVLGQGDADLAIRVFNIETSGNFKDEATGRLTGNNILHLKGPITEAAHGLNMSEADLILKLENIRGRLFNRRIKRTRPGKDDKILTDWNGLMISALARAAQTFGEPAYAEAARRAADFILTHMRDRDGRILHRYRDGQAAVTAGADDYAFLIMGLLDLYEAVFETSYLKAALELNTAFLNHFWDEEHGGFYFTSDDAPLILTRVKKSYDGAVPSANSVAMMNLIRLARMTGGQALEETAGTVGRTLSFEVEKFPSSHAFLLMAVMFQVWGSSEVVISGDPETEDARAMMEALRRTYAPNKVVLSRPAGPDEPEIVQIAEFTQNQLPLNGRATAYICENRVCRRPVTDVGEMIRLLKGD